MEGWDIKTILVGYDGSEGSDKALALATALARQDKARVVVVTTFDLPYFDLAPDWAAVGARAGSVIVEAQETAQDAASRLEAAGIEAETDVVDGPAGQALINAADARQVDLIVVGRRGRGMAASLLLGSTTEYVVRRATVPVLVAH